MNQKSKKVNKTVKYFIILSQIFFISCGFYSMAGSIPPHIKSIAIPLMDNQTAEFGLAEDITDGIIEQFNDAGILRISDEKSAHSILRGTIKKVSEGPYTYSKQESVSEYRYKIDVKIEWYDILEEKNIFEGVYSGFGAYGLSGDIGSDGIDNDSDNLIDSEDSDEFGLPRESAMRIAVEEIADKMINELISTW